ncbi:hypothetical protein PENTCL1PPCAC_2024 [Pristionchus entomophagus]|uniref:Carboxylesterase type B domain-containing protein n=1 Tax=Pristionchus entomophagus TaxID=358040 RepID=A0AAV5SAU6_9BILA|nr:hypothetical protein PENTCL1PPCAC_2024 [Pristionchus entomophagus]
MEGFCLTDSPIEVNAFMSVPFAEPPVRFTKPVAKGNWSGVLETKVMPPRRIQSASDAISEDCLYLNVFAPATGSGKGSVSIQPSCGFPVITVVYGGAFATGRAVDQVSLEHIAKYIVSKGVIVVVIQYRVGPLGFCTTGDSVMPGKKLNVGCSYGIEVDPG